MARKEELAAVRAAKARKKRRRRKKWRRVIIGLELFILFCLAGAAFVMAKYNKFQIVNFQEDEIEVNEGLIPQEGYTSIALFGGDSREGALEEGTHADTIIIVSIDNESRQIRMASLYRDTLLQQADGTYRKANNAYFVGGPGEAINMLNKNLDLDIQDYVTVDFKAMSDVVDLLGGIELNVTDAEAEMLNKYVDETAKAAGKEAHKLNGGGTYLLDGPQAVTYARLRKLDGGDYKRTERQRVVIKLLFEKVKTADIVELNEILNTVFPQISTSLGLDEMLALGSVASKYQLEASKGFPFEKMDGITYPDAGDVVVPQELKENVEELHTFLYPGGTGWTASSTVEAISDDIAYLTGVYRPEGMESEIGKDMDNTPTIVDENGNPIGEETDSGEGSQEAGQEEDPGEAQGEE